ncbi:type I-U CRISPR-associated protein Csx17 [bacterium]|nr:type I-U CRISPR-associated protein Csx17 [bacterium]
MSSQTYEIELSGCTPVPLAHYLKALGVLRLVAEQADSNAKGWWKNDRFWLQSKLDREGLLKFFQEEYEPTPLVAPWNGGSGFYPKDNAQAMSAICNGQAIRFGRYRETIAVCRKILDDLDLKNKPTDNKPELLQHCRNRVPDYELDWLDAAYLLTSDGPKYPPLLGTGGNDGRLEFTNNFMQHLQSIFNFDDGSGLQNSDQELQESLFSKVSNVRSSGTIGQYDPGSLGGANNGSGFDGCSAVNAWDYILMMEGAITFASASVKKLESSDGGILAYPFCVRQAGVGYGSADTSDEESTRSEMWLPIWNSPTTFSAISTLMSEGRVVVGKRKPRNGVDFARAIATLGTDRGIDEFQRYAFQQRNGLAYFAVPLGRFSVQSKPSVEELVAPLDQWLDRFRRAATGKNASGRAGRALRKIETAILKICQRGETQDVQELLIALGEAEATVAISKALREGDMGSGIRPVPLLSTRWLDHSNDNSVEFRLAAALASITHRSVGPFRRHLEPLDHTSWKSSFPKWAGETSDPSLVWGDGSLVRNMLNVIQRRIIDVLKSGKEANKKELQAPLYGYLNASLGDISKFIAGEIDDQRIESLLKGFILIDWSSLSKDQWVALQGPQEPKPDAAYSLLKLCHLNSSIDEKSIRLDPRISHLAISGKISEATQVASRRLRASGFRPALEQVYLTGEAAKRTAAALLFPLNESSARQLLKRVIRCEKDDNKDEQQSQKTTSITT